MKLHKFITFHIARIRLNRLCNKMDNSNIRQLFNLLNLVAISYYAYLLSSYIGEEKYIERRKKLDSYLNELQEFCKEQ